jgi:hypothetical protein
MAFASRNRKRHDVQTNGPSTVTNYGLIKHTVVIAFANRVIAGRVDHGIIKIRFPQRYRGIVTGGRSN